MSSDTVVFLLIASIFMASIKLGSNEVVNVFLVVISIYLPTYI